VQNHAYSLQSTKKDWFFVAQNILLPSFERSAKVVCSSLFSYFFTRVGCEQQRHKPSPPTIVRAPRLAANRQAVRTVFVLKEAERALLGRFGYQSRCAEAMFQVA
jgi:hypothetical protein